MWHRYVSLMEFWKESLSVWYVVILVSSAKSAHIDYELTVGVRYSCMWEEAGGKVWETEELHTLRCPCLCICTVWIERFDLCYLFHAVNISSFVLNDMRFHYYMLQIFVSMINLARDLHVVPRLWWMRGSFISCSVINMTAVNILQYIYVICNFMYVMTSSICCDPVPLVGSGIISKWMDECFGGRLDSLWKWPNTHR